MDVPITSGEVGAGGRSGIFRSEVFLARTALSVCCLAVPGLPAFRGGTVIFPVSLLPALSFHWRLLRGAFLTCGLDLACLEDTATLPENEFTKLSGSGATESRVKQGGCVVGRWGGWSRGVCIIRVWARLRK